MGKHAVHLAIIAAAFALTADSHVKRAQAIELESCPVTSDETDFSGEALNLLTELKDGVVYDDSGAVGLLRLAKEGANFRSTALGINDLTVFAAVADFDKDGWDDFVGAGEGTKFVRIYRNFSFENLPVNWEDPDDILTPEFRPVRELHAAWNQHRWHPIAAADFDGDSWPDVFYASAYTYQRPYEAMLWLNQGNNDGSGNPRFDSAYSAMAPGSYPSQLGYQNWGGTNTVAVDYNGDRKLDLLVGSGETDGGAIRIFLNDCTLQSPLPSPAPAPPLPLPCADKPQFVYAGYLARDMGMGGNGGGELPVFAYLDFDGDGFKDLVAGAPRCCSTSSLRLRVWKGLSGGGIESSSSQHISFIGAATSVLPGDFSLDGIPDLIVGTDNWNYNYGNIGGNSYFYPNNGTDEPFSAGYAQQTTVHNNPTYDFDVGFVFDYDNDPDHTPDVMIADGNHTASFYVLANRVVNTFVPCGDVASGILDLGSLVDEEMVVTAARIDPTVELNDGTIDFFMSNEEPPNWQPAVDCGDGSGDLCTSFPKPVGREVRWKATMCSNSYQTQTPKIVDIDMTFDYTTAREHYRAGVVVNDGVAYVGAFRQPGDRGHFYATNAGLTQVYWDAATKLDGMSDGARTLYTASTNGRRLVSFAPSNASDADLQATLGTTDSTQTADVVSWVRSARFGVGNIGIEPSKLGAIETSTPAVVTKPGLPLWYTHAASSDREDVDEFISAQSDRETLVLFGSKDGMIHALRNDPTAIAASSNGTEAWAFIPAKIAGGMLADYSNSLGGDLNVTAYPDGSPTVADVRLSDGEMHTVAMVSSGNGGKSIAAMDITETIDPNSGAIIGPDPLWHKQPGGSSAGQAFNKPAIARIQVDGTERFIAIMGTGIDYSSTTRGRIIHAYDISTGSRLWKFRTRCALSSDITVFETDDDNEPGTPDIDGYIDRVVFADQCGYVYKLDPAQDLSGGWNDNSNMGDFHVHNAGGVPQHAVFSSELTTDALGIAAPIAGTIAARSDSTGRVMLLFGTGGIESYDPGQRNDFYAVYADTGEIRSVYNGTCNGSNYCEKFYGGTLVTSEQIVFTRATDPEVGTGSCDPGSATVEGVKLNPNGDGEFVTDFTETVNSAIMGSLYGDAGAIYFATLAGDVTRIGTPRSPDAGGDSAGGLGGGTSGENGGGAVDTTKPMALMGWRQVY